MDCRSFSESARRWLAGLCIGASVAFGAGGCVTVQPQDKEYLADPSMTFGSEGEVGAHEQHVFENREASYGARGVSGGGCGCN